MSMGTIICRVVLIGLGSACLGSAFGWQVGLGIFALAVAFAP